jgi:hypothetical protein
MILNINKNTEIPINDEIDYDEYISKRKEIMYLSKTIINKNVTSLSMIKEKQKNKKINRMDISLKKNKLYKHKIDSTNKSHDNG